MEEEGRGRLGKVPKCTKKYQTVPRCTKRYWRLPWGTKGYKGVPRGTGGYQARRTEVCRNIQDCSFHYISTSMTLTSLTTDFFQITGWALFPKILFGHVFRKFTLKHNF